VTDPRAFSRQDHSAWIQVHRFSSHQLKHTNMRSKFKDEHTFEKRKAEAERIRQKYTDRIPVRFTP